jgi:hypothetical protein
VSTTMTDTDRLVELTEAVCDENASPEELVALDSMLLAEAAARRPYLDYCQLHVALEVEMQAHWALQEACRPERLDAAALAPWESQVLSVLG